MDQEERMRVLNVVLDQIERKFGKPTLTNKEYRAKLVKIGNICATCEKRYCDCKCGCKHCWGNSNNENVVGDWWPDADNSKLC